MLEQFPLYTRSECITKLAKYRGKRPTEYPEYGTGVYPEELKTVSTTIRIRDFHYLAKIRSDYIFRFIAGTLVFGEKRLRRLSRALWLADNGYIVKHQWRVYQIIDEPIKENVKQEISISINLGSGGGVKIKPMTNNEKNNYALSFNKIFGGKN